MDTELTAAMVLVRDEILRQADEGRLPDSTKEILTNLLRTVYEQADAENDWDLDIG